VIPIVLRLLLDFLSLKNDVNVPSKSNKQKNFVKNSFFVGVLEVNDENSRIRISIRIHTKIAWKRNTGKEVTVSHLYARVHGSPTGTAGRRTSDRPDRERAAPPSAGCCAASALTDP
jgi:hypothetical protein